jgi:hypothetical protein
MNKICSLRYFHFSLFLCLILIFLTAVPVKADQEEASHQSSEGSETTELIGSTDDNSLEYGDFEPLCSEEFAVDPGNNDHQTDNDDPGILEKSDLKAGAGFGDPDEHLLTGNGSLGDSADPALEIDRNDQKDSQQSGNFSLLASNQFQLDDPAPFSGEQQPLVVSLAESSPTMQNIDDYWIIETFAHLNEVRLALNDKYRLANDITIPDDTNWDPIGIYHKNPFKGIFDGNGYKISGLNIVVDKGYVGFFGYVENAKIMKLNLVDVNIDAGSGSYVGGLVGRADNITIDHCSVDGLIKSGGNSIGGLVGYFYDSRIYNSFSDSEITGHTKTQSIGGLVGFVGNSCQIENSYALGSVIGNQYVGGLVGYLALPDGEKDQIVNSYSATVVNIIGSGNSDIGGLVGGCRSSATTKYCYWDTDTSGQLGSARGDGRTKEKMMEEITYENWDFVDTWFIEEGVSYPILRWQIVDDPSNPDDPDDPGEDDGDGDSGAGGQDDDDDLPGDGSNDYPSDLSMVGNSNFLMLFDQVAGFDTEGLFFKLLGMIRQIEKLIALIKEAGENQQANILTEIDFLFAEIKELFEANRYRLSPAEEKFILARLESISAALTAD